MPKYVILVVETWPMGRTHRAKPEWFGYSGHIRRQFEGWKMAVHPGVTQLRGGTGARLTLTGPGSDDAAQVLVVNGVRADPVVHGGRVRRRRTKM